MFLKPFQIDPKLTISAIVAKDYRTAEVFRRYGIGYCCGGKWPLDMTCEMQGIDAQKLTADLDAAMRTVHVSNQLAFAEWDSDFLINYIINIHHQYLKTTLPSTAEILKDFAGEHAKKYPFVNVLVKKYDFLQDQLLEGMKQEEEVLFPYIRQVAHAHTAKEAYASLLVKTLRKPVEKSMFKGQGSVKEMIHSIRELTSDYTTPEKACTSHKVIFAKLREIDIDLSQHHYLEQGILFPRAIALENEVLSM